MTFFIKKNNLNITEENVKRKLHCVEKTYVYILPVENPNRC